MHIFCVLYFLVWTTRQGPALRTRQRLDLTHASGTSVQRMTYAQNTGHAILMMVLAKSTISMECVSALTRLPAHGSVARRTFQQEKGMCVGGTHWDESLLKTWTL